MSNVSYLSKSCKLKKPVSLPFVLLHRCIHLRPKSFVRLPVRFVPVSSGQFTVTLHATVHPMDDGLSDSAGFENQHVKKGGTTSIKSRGKKTGGGYGVILTLKGKGQ